MHRHKTIGFKDIYVVRDHHHVLLPWAMIRRRLNGPPLLLTLDHHTDTRSAFLGYLYEHGGPDDEELEDHRAELLADIDFRSDEYVERAIAKLRYDEHIQAATRTGIVDVAFAIQLDESRETLSEEVKDYHERRYGNFPENLEIDGSDELGWSLEVPDVPEPQPPFTYVLPESRIFVVPHECFPGCTEDTHTDDCLPRVYDGVLEDDFLGPKLAEANAMAPFAGIDSIESRPYILDIDLDYFHTVEGTSPRGRETIFRLIRNCAAITIALEPEWVERNDYRDNGHTSEFLLERVESLIREALSAA